MLIDTDYLEKVAAKSFKMSQINNAIKKSKNGADINKFLAQEKGLTVQEHIAESRKVTESSKKDTYTLPEIRPWQKKNEILGVATNPWIYGTLPPKGSPFDHPEKLRFH